MSVAVLTLAAHFAAQKHKSQKRKGASGEPYINHPIAVAELLARHNAPIEVIAAAYLHDTVEDTETSFDELENMFGSVICDIVREVTDEHGIATLERKRRQVESAPRATPPAKMLKIADKCMNLRDILYNPPETWTVERKIAYFHWARDVVAGCRGVNPSLEAEFDALHGRGLRLLQGDDV